MEASAAAPMVLVLEDEAIIAIDVENILTDAGMTVAGTLGSCADALVWLEANLADVALLDMHLLDGSCERVARRLVEKGIPFVVFSGDSEADEDLDPIFTAGAWLEKPAPADRIVAAVKAGLQAKAAAEGG
jgi:DNA-binding response OmpR family regulator